MDIGHESSTTMSISVEDRLSVVRNAVRKVQEEALKQVSSNNNNKTSSQQQFSDPNASFNLGMELFGQDIVIVQKNIREKLDQVEKDLILIQKQLKISSSSATTTTTTAYGGDENQENSDPATSKSTTTSDDRDDDDDNNNNTTKTREELQKEAGMLSKKINFLRQCSLARSYLDESITLSKPGLSSDPDWVEAALKISQAEEALNEAHNLLSRDEKYLQQQQQYEQQTNTTLAKDKDTKSSTLALLQAGYKIIDSIHASVRRERVDLMDQAKSLFDLCVNFDEHAISIRGGGTSHQHQHHHHNPMTRDNSNVGGGVGRGGGGSSSNNNTINKMSLQAAYDVLDALSPDPTNSALKDTLRQFTTKFYRRVLKPVIELTTKTRDQQSLEWHFEDTIDDINHHDTTTPPTIRSGRKFKVKGPVCRLEWKRPPRGRTPKSVLPNMQKETIILENWKQALNFCHRTMEFVHLHVLMERESLCQQVGNQLFGKPNAMPSTMNLEALGLESCMIGGNDNGLVMESLVDALAKTCIPAKLEPNEMPKLQAMAEMLRNFTHPFVQTLVEMNYITANDDDDDMDDDDDDDDDEGGGGGGGGVDDDTDDGSAPRHRRRHQETRLEKFSSNFEQKYIDNRRCNILNEARNILLKNDYHNTVVTGVDVNAKREKDEILRELDNGMDVFELHQSSISSTASKLLALVRSTMDEAVDHAVARKDEDRDTPMEVLPPSLYRAARECLDLYRAVIPAQYGKEVVEVPRTAAVFHNDCVFLQYQCLWLGLEYKAKLPPVPKDSNDARATLFHQACSFLDMVPLFRELADRSMGDMLERQSQQIVEIVGKRVTLFGQALRSDEILAEWSEAETALSAGLYHLRHLSETWKMVLSHDVFVRSVGYLADALFTLYLDQVTKATDISESACHFVSALFRKATSTLEEFLGGDKSGSLVWSRFEAVGRFMDMTLLDIQAGLADGVFRSVTGPELSNLITATFAESEKRKRLLQALASS